nr:glycosyltransferase [Okeania hirsuta]
MVNAPLPNIKEECLLWQVDVDEIWTLEQICDTRKLFIKNPDKTAAFYWCWYFVGENLLIRTRNCYAQNPQREWLRTWRFKPGYVWASHSPPILVENLPDGKQKNIAAINPFMHAETEKEGLIFQHFAYVTPEQLSFKQQYYGYKNAVSQWQSLQSQTKFPVYLRDYFAWVKDNTMVDRPKTLGIVPLVQKNVTAGSWKFLEAAYLQKPVKLEKRSPTIIIDGIFFQLSSTGIARVWRSVLGEWAKTEFAQHIIVLDRVNTSPKIPGIRYRQIPAYNYNNTDADKQMLQQVCDEEGADLFISTYYTTPISTPSVFMAYDMIPEALETDLNKAMWREKHHAISHAFSYISISENTARDLVKFFPDIQADEVSVAHCGVAPTFTPATTTEINGFKHKYGISKPYFLLVGAGSNYKNAILFFQAFAQLYSKQGFEIVWTGSGFNLANEYREYSAGSVIHSLILSDEELKVAYSGAVALVYPSLYEGFGMPVAEALACGCPVITCANSSIPEVAGEAAIYVDANDVDGLTDALCEVQKPKVRNSLIAAGLEQVKEFSWEKMADIMSAALMKATLQRLNLREINLIIFPDWSQPEETVGLELQEVIKSLVTHPDRSKMTLLIDNSNISAEDADLILSSVAMNLLMESELEVDKGPEIVLVGELSQIQWSALIAQLQGRIKLEHENEEAITVVDENLAVYEIQGIERLRAISLETGGWELFKLSEINFIIFPDWSQPEETVGLELQAVIKNLVSHPEKAKMTLLIDNSNISAEDADLILSSVAMNLLMESELEVDEGPEIILLGELSQIQWSALIPQLQGRIKLEHENEEAKAQVKADSIPSIAVDSLKEKLDGIDLSSKQIIPKQDNFEKQPINKIKSESLTEKEQAEKILSELEILEKGTTENGQPVGFFRQIGDVESYYEQTQKVVNDIHSFIFQNPNNQTAHQIAKWFTLKAKLFLYFSQANLKEIYQKRAEIIEFALKIEGYQVDYDFPERAGDRQKIRLGIIANNFEPHPETFATLPVYKHLNREEFEVILYYLQASGHPLERYCFDHADAAIELPEDLELQVKAIRNDDLDILFISTNITSQTNAITLLASHRLARIQIVGMNSPVTTGMRHIDCYISSKLTDSETNAKEHYTEKLVTLDGPDQCFDFAIEKELSVTTTISRKELNIDENTVVYISGANFYKIIPEVEATWVKIIAQVPNSMLLLYPFNPNWAPTYPIEAFKERFFATLSKYGVSEKRLCLLNALPNRADIKECLKLANIYLDAYPFSGMTSLIDPLQICLPTVVMQKESARSRRGASLLRYLEMPELIADSEDAYIQLAVNLGNNSDLRAVYRDRIETKMQANPQFLDSRYYSSQMGYLFQKVFQEYLELVMN